MLGTSNLTETKDAFASTCRAPGGARPLLTSSRPIIIQRWMRISSPATGRWLSLLRSKAFPFRKARSQNAARLQSISPVEGFWGRLPVFKPSRALAWAKARIRPADEARSRESKTMTTLRVTRGRRFICCNLDIASPVWICHEARKTGLTEQEIRLDPRPRGPSGDAKVHRGVCIGPVE